MTPIIPGCVPPFSHSRYWRDLWRQKKLALLAAPKYRTSHSYWKNKQNVLELYLKSRKTAAWQEKIRSHLDFMKISAGSRVLDIGGGTGTLAVPLAARGCRVTVVEPSPMMREGLAENECEAGVSGIRVIPKRWEDVSLQELDGPFDAVIDGYALSMPDIGEALEKMQASCTGTVHLFWFLTPPAWDRISIDLWPALHGGVYPGEPLADCLWQVLYEMGIHANLTVEAKRPTFFSSVEAAAQDYFQRLNCSTPEQEQVLLSYFGEHLHRSGDGFSFGGRSFSAHIWWNGGDGTA
ncbi:class I SAM-dependent methyltransferase [Methanosphaerula palustris]|uniref:Methyltransferase type 12 n=1 Tax=Methanosphaerula palustris (strain ATCC BAA-1556 / DSM 19958 / E1-9c) TaxID=521011 RepID=B8GIT7_METPE|nr:class I SAM-dependent methyltransferase [Methanosphaerula palustris]ACL16900.1 Methyltransferase type 12 [Methanosphaerula palustris E1-9c]